MVTKSSAPIYLDIETGGIDPSKSSILTIAAGEMGNLHTGYARPTPLSFLSEFSEQKIIPQLLNKKLSTEQSIIESLINRLEQNPTTPLAGYNIRGFDLGFIQQRARRYNLESRFTRSLKRREIIDPVYQVKDIVAGAISSHAERGTFQQQLGGLSWAQAEEQFGHLAFQERPPEYNLIAQVKGYLHANRETAMFKGWKLEDMYRILQQHGAVGPVEGMAHEAAVDIRMTEAVLHAARTGKMEEVFNTPSAATSWMNIVKERGYHQFGRGRTIQEEDLVRMGLARKFPTKWLLGIGAAVSAVWAANKISSRDDDYNTIEGLPHGGLAQTGRLQLTDFGSGYRGIISVGEHVLKKLEVRGGFQIGIEDALALRKSFRSSLRNARPEVRSEFASFYKSVREAKRAGRESIIGIQKNFNWKSLGLDLRATIYHERLHENISSSGMRGLFFSGNTPENIKRGSSIDRSVQAYLHPHIKEEEYLVRILEYIRSPTQYKAARKISSNLRDLIPTSSEQKEALELAQRWEVPVSKRRGGKFSGKDDNYNTIEGLKHGGFAEKLRKLLTPFGSGWDALRNLVKSGETFEKMLGKKSFQTALSQANRIKVLGKGQLGEAHLMETTFRGKTFQFVRKTGQIGDTEASSMKALQHDMAPTVYGHSEHHLDMELFQGKTVKAAIQGDEFTDIHMMKIQETMQKMHQAGIMHGDFHWENMMITNKGEIGAIDFGASGRIGTSGTVRTNQGEFQYTGFRKSGKVGDKWMRENIEVRHPEWDTGRLEMLQERWEARKALLAPAPPPTPPVPESSLLFSQPLTETDLSRTIKDSKIGAKKLNQANLQRSASKTVWAHGKNAGRRSRT